MKTSEQKYILTQSEYDILTRNLQEIQVILSNATIIDSKTQKILERPPVVVEKLTSSKMQELFGTNYHHILYYNFDSGRWNTDRIMGWKLTNDLKATIMCQNLKDILEHAPEFNNLDVVAVVYMPVVKKNINPGTILENPKPATKLPTNATSAAQNQLGCHGAVGTIVCRNKNTGQIRPVPNQWIHYPARHSLRQIPIDFVQLCIKSTEPLNNLIKIHAR